MLNSIDLSLKLEKEEYEKELIKYQVAIYLLGYQVYVQQRPVIIGLQLQLVVIHG